MKITILSVLALAGSVASAQLWNNGNPLGGDMGNPLNSVIDTGGTLFGFGHQANLGNTVADDFTAAQPWNITSLSFFAYQTGATSNTFTGANWQIANSHGDPISMTTSAVSDGGLVGYRVTATTLTNTQRPIFRVDITGLNVNLPAGSYVIRWGLTGSLASGPWAPYIPGSRGGSSSNAQQSLANGAYAPALDNTQGVELPFIINGTIVPAPASLALLGLGGLVAGRRRR